MDLSKILKEANPLILAVPPYGSFTLLILIGHDYGWLSDESTRTLPSRTFVAQFLQRHLLDPQRGLEDVTAFPNEQLQAITIAWWNAQRECRGTIELAKDATLDEIKSAFIHYYEAHILPLQTELKRVASGYQGIVAGIANTTAQKLIGSAHVAFPPTANMFSESILKQGQLLELNSPSLLLSGIAEHWIEQGRLVSQMIAETLRSQVGTLASLSAKALQPSKFFQALPGFSDFQKLLDEWKEAKETFQETDFWFIQNFLPARVLFEFDSYPEEGRSKRINGELIDITMDEQFGRLMFASVEKSTVLPPRLPILQEAYTVYQSGKYHTATPALLAQVEGVIGDALLLKNEVLVQDNKLYWRDSNGQVKRSKKDNKPLGIQGLGALITVSKWEKTRNNHPLLNCIAEFISSTLSQDRNGILHGRNLVYGNDATTAAQCLWILRYLTEQIKLFEDGNVEDL